MAVSGIQPSITQETSSSSDITKQVGSCVLIAEDLSHRTQSKPSMSNDAMLGGTPIKKSNSGSDGEALDGSFIYRASWKTGRILQHFAVRSPHILISAGAVYLITHYYFNDHKQAIENATFVGIASAAYCLVKPFFLETIPSSLLSPQKKPWRELINVTYTVFTTLTLSSCVWGLKVPALKGLAIWIASFGPSTFLLQKIYSTIDADFKVNP